ncbi:hypothetical protein BU24DRAFT_108756 [Aaosphaeria arxii CBS 175.79]|uniref:Uncharacterized protein n=1 Tax=Aaosphaeria arxii CBS 175.79 TaxID=1450172 RepID=A0A6A5Y156_9PLEO|nr:uncharacterized protein BU24DRAFT_108756 [Aaosphaeria arxii CBS 175.79]KAF2018933.1 hypothetical protein BU24DRAFT_108756 [Aaosphaeria arxii CBS 175.79]
MSETNPANEGSLKGKSHTGLRVVCVADLSRFTKRGEAEVPTELHSCVIAAQLCNTHSTVSEAGQKEWESGADALLIWSRISDLHCFPFLFPPLLFSFFAFLVFLGGGNYTEMNGGAVSVDGGVTSRRRGCRREFLREACGRASVQYVRVVHRQDGGEGRDIPVEPHALLGRGGAPHWTARVGFSTRNSRHLFILV